jgi:CheY-like chemotaxis protein
MDHPSAKTVPIIAMTANAYREDVEHALEAGMNAHVAKPIDIGLLLSVLDECIKKGKAL